MQSDLLNAAFLLNWNSGNFDFEFQDFKKSDTKDKNSVKNSYILPQIINNCYTSSRKFFFYFTNDKLDILKLKSTGFV